MHLYQYTLHTTNSCQWHSCIYIPHLLITYPHTTSCKTPVSHTHKHARAHIQQQLNHALSLHMPLSHSHTPHDKHTVFIRTLTQTHLSHTRGSTHDRWLLMVTSGVPSGRCTTAQSRLSQFFVWTLVNSESTQADGGVAYIYTHPIAYP